ncbi:hypothetical protein L798_05986 [Zootermopsis nevadensis]|uniref:Uncharacterized protein n=1 Tax=Zootermopsis nevadensis TaxID=136037 RepID=A0A067RAJ6_ZOONE|nr:hypothetical protein L798_05986 [Zootermopsis nevadensis]
MLLVPQHVLILRLVYVRYEVSRSLVVHHGHRGSTEQPPLELDQLTEKATVRPDRRSSRPEIAESFPQRHSLVFHEVGKAQGGRAADSRHTMNQRLAIRTPHLKAHHIISVFEHNSDIDVHHIVPIYVLITFLT